MGIVDLIGFKWKLNKPFLTRTEQQILKKLRASGRLSSFRVTECERVLATGERCSNEVPIILDDETKKPLKRFCSERCFNLTEQDNEDEDDGDDTEDNDA